MTRKGKLPINIPTGVDVKVADNVITVKGPKGTLKQDLMPGIELNLEGSVMTVSANIDTKFHGLYRTLIANMVVGATQGFEKTLDMIGVGYRAAVQGKSLNLQVGFSHPTLIPIPADIEVTIEKGTKIIIKGSDKQMVGQFAAAVRCIRPPEPYQGKGIRYTNEYVRKKAGKAAAKA